VSTAPAPQARASALARGWRNFRRWRRGRPFWGGLLLVLSGIELFLSANQDLRGLQVHVGQTGFLSYIIPAIVLLCGVCTMFFPQQRLFYGIVGACAAVFSLIGLNLGGFFIGMLLGILGGALAASWTPVTPAPQPPVQPRGQEPDDATVGEPADTAELMSGPLTDVLPNSMRSPLAEPPAESPPQRHPYRDGRLLAITLVPLTLIVAIVAGARQSGVALADQCPPAAGTATRTTAAPAPAAPAPAAPAPAAPTKAPTTASATPAPSPTTSAAPDGRGNPIGNAVQDFLDAIAGLFGRGKQQAEPAPSQSAEPSAAPSARATTAPAAPPAAGPTSTRPAPAPTTAKPCGSAPVRKLAVDPGQPPVNVKPSIMTAGTLTMSGLSFDGVVELPTAKGPVRTLRFSMNKSVSRPFELRVPFDSRTLSLTSSALTVQGDVKFYSSRFEGKLFGLIPVVFTPDAPPPLILPELLFTDANIQLMLVQTDTLTAPNLTIAYHQ